MFIFLHSIKTNIRTIRREVFEYSNNIRIFKVARIQIRIEIFVKNCSNIQIIRIFVTTLADMSIIIIGGSFVLFLVVMIVLSIVICRRINKLDLLKCSMKSFKLQLSFYCLLAAVDNF